MKHLDTSNKTCQQGSLAEILSMSIPMIVSNACETLIVFVDRLFLAQVSPEAMNAALGAGMTYFLMTTFFAGLVGYSTALTAQYFGAQRKNHCSLVFTQAAIITIVAFPVILLLRPLIHYYFEHVGLSAIQLPLQIEYFNLVCYAAIFTLGRAAFAGFFIGTGRTRVIMIAAVTAMVVNVVADYVLIFGKFGFPALGVKGAAYGTILGLACSMFIGLIAYLRKENRLTYQVGQSLKFVPQIMKKLLRYGSPTGLEFFLSLIAFNGIVMTFHAKGDVVATAVTIMFNWDLVAFLPLVGLEISVMSLVGRYMGAQMPHLAKKSAYSGIKLGFGYSFVMFLAFIIFPHLLVGVFADVNNPVFAAATPIAVDMVRIAALYVIANVFILIFIGTLRGAGDTIWPMAISIIVNWAALASTILLLHVFDASAQWAWFAFSAIFMVCSLAYIWRFKQGKWQQLKII